MSGDARVRTARRSWRPAAARNPSYQHHCLADQMADASSHTTRSRRPADHGQPLTKLGRQVDRTLLRSERSRDRVYPRRNGRPSIRRPWFKVNQFSRNNCGLVASHDAPRHLRTRTRHGVPASPLRSCGRGTARYSYLSDHADGDPCSDAGHSIDSRHAGALRTRGSKRLPVTAPRAACGIFLVFGGHRLPPVLIASAS